MLNKILEGPRAETVFDRKMPIKVILRTKSLCRKVFVDGRHRSKIFCRRLLLGKILFTTENKFKEVAEKENRRAQRDP